MNGTTHHYLAPADAPESAAQRAAASHHAIEQAISSLLTPFWPATVVTGMLPAAGDALAVRLAGCGPVQPDTAALLLCRIQLEARGGRRESLCEAFASLASRFPMRGGAVDQLAFGILRAAGNATFDTDTRFGAIRYTAAMELEVELDLLNSTFAPYTPPAVPATPAALSGILECALAQFLATDYQLTAQCAPLSKAADGVALQLLRLDVPQEMRQEADFRLTLQLPERDIRFDALSRLLAALPREALSLELARGSVIHCFALSCPEPPRMTQSPWPEQRRTATATLRMTLDLSQSVFASADQPDGAPRPALPDPVELERRLTDWLGDQLRLTVDRDLWRGMLPHGKNGMAVQFRRQSVNSSSQTFDFGFELLIRDGSRDRAMQLLSSASALFPVRSELGTIEMECKKAELESISELGICKTQGKIELLLRFA